LVWRNFAPQNRKTEVPEPVEGPKRNMSTSLEDNYRHKGLRQQLVELLRTKGITDEAVLSAINEVPRHIFLDSSFVELAYQDKAFPIGSGQTISQPHTVAFQTQLLQVKKGMKVLEIGTGSGYQACVLAAMGAKVFSIERQRNLFFKTKEILEQLPFKVKTFLGDGYEGLTTYQPFDRIIITAGAPSIPEKLIEQLKPGGIMVIPMDNAEGDGQTMLRVTKLDDGTLKQESFGDFKFVPMLKEIGND
jgi:protein-L-isoaspartate(D-aspartate) O-methyltransferase